MNIVVTKKDLHRALERIYPCADQKSAVPALANVLLTAEGRSLHVAATDLYLGMRTTIDCEPTALGTIALPAKDLFERVKAMPEGPVQISTTDGAQTVIKAVGQARRYTLHGLPGVDFPTLPKPGDHFSITMPANALLGLIRRTDFSISPDETRAHVNSALFEISPRGSRMVTTDGHRLSKVESQEKSERAFVALIPAKAVARLKALLDGAKGSDSESRVTIRMAGAHTAFFEVAGFVFSTKLTDAQFPPWEQVVPAAPTHTVAVPRLAFVDALKAVQLASSDRIGGVKLSLVPGALRITSESPESGSGADEIPVDFSGGEAQIGVNAKYVLDCLGALDGDDVLFCMSGELDPMLIRPRDGDDFLGVVMPMRTT